MNDNSNLRMMEKHELRSFKELLKVKDKTLLRTVIIDVCGI
jgi:succinate dehydrogenase flavin-adding protein (antitoxin of CptAB toxin-antitoxin module)